MLIKYTFPIAGDIFLPEHWPIRWGQYCVTWTVKEKKAEAVTISVRTNDHSGAPRIERNIRPDISTHFNMGEHPYYAEVDSILRTARGLLGFFAAADIDFERPSIAWEAETPEEEDQLQVLSFSIEPAKPEEPLPITFDLVARCFLAAIPASAKEIPLSFLAKGRRDMQTGRFIDAYYSFFFFFETQFAPGISNPKMVTKKFKAASEIMGALNEAREKVTSDPRPVRGMGKLLKRSDEELIEHLVTTRGRLHHHALPHRKGLWHPDKHREFEAEAHFLHCLANEVSMRQYFAMLFEDAITEGLREAAKMEGVEYTYVVEAEGDGDQRGIKGLPTLSISLPCRAPSHTSLAAVDEHLRSEGGPYNRRVVKSYTIKSTDGSQVFAWYKNNILPDVGPGSIRKSG